MESIVVALITAMATTLAAGGGVWGYFKGRDETREATTHLLMGLAQIQILHLSMTHLERGYISNHEFENLRRYLYEPYTRLGGNGTAERVMIAVQRLPFREESSLMERAFKSIDIRETDTTGLPNDKKYEGEERRG